MGQWIPTYPMDVLKSRISEAAPGTYNNVRDAAMQSYKAEGLGVFWRGLTPALLRAFPLHAFVFLGYEQTLKMLE